MTLHYHGTPITPNAVMLTLPGKCFCVSYGAPQQVRLAHEIGQSVMLDNGIFRLFQMWRAGKITDDEYAAMARALVADYYAWCDPWLDRPTTWAVIPDVIDAGSQQQDALIREWPHGQKGAPVWHMDEPIDRALRLLDEWPRVCIGSTGEYWQVCSAAWERRQDALWNAIASRHKRTPNVHMLRGMQLSGQRWPFASVDSTDVGQNHNRPQNTARAMADRWDASQCAARWLPRPTQGNLFEEAAS